MHYGYDQRRLFYFDWFGSFFNMKVRKSLVYTHFYISFKPVSLSDRNVNDSDLIYLNGRHVAWKDRGELSPVHHT